MLTIIDKNTTINLSKLDLACLSFQVEPIEANHEYEDNEGLDGYADIDTTYNGRKLYSRWFLKTDNHDKFHEQKDKVYRLFAPKKELILIDQRQPFKRWVAQVESQGRIDNDEGATFKEFEVNFISKNVYAEAVEPYKKTFKEQTFYVMNDGTETIDAREHELVVTFKGASNKLRIKNNDTGDEWQYFGTTAAGDAIKLDSVYPYKNGQNIFGDTNHGALTLVPGANDIRIYGASGSFEVSFEFVPLYI